jgi:3-deoxy-D-manno-octulosonic-acid transferase
MSMLTLYRLTTTLLTPCASPFLSWRASQGKEDPARLGERMGRPGAPRPPGRLVWLHGASVGESLSLEPLIERFVQRDIEVLVTSGTASSAKILRERLPAGAVHQFLPLDAPRFVERFLDYWRPDMALFAESELWPNIVRAIHARGTPFALVNARMSQQSAARWRSAGGVGGQLFGMIDLCLAQSPEDAARFLGLGAPRVRVAGNLKFDVPPPPAEASKLAEFSGALGARPVWAAVSTHPGEEEIVLSAHAEISAKTPGLMTIVAPRHPERGADVSRLAQDRGLRVARRSQGEAPARGVDIYVADTIGELGLYFRTAGLVFMGKSLAVGGGQNPIEPAKLGCAILHGPDVANFAEAYSELNAAKAAARVQDAQGLARAAQFLLAEPSRLRKMGRAGIEAVEKLGGASRNIMTALEPYLLQMALEKR